MRHVEVDDATLEALLDGIDVDPSVGDEATVEDALNAARTQMRSK